MTGRRQKTGHSPGSAVIAPADWLITLLEKKSVNPEWIRTGLGHRLLQAPTLAAVDRRPVEECTTDELLTEIVRRALKGMVWPFTGRKQRKCGCRNVIAPARPGSALGRAK